MRMRMREFVRIAYAVRFTNILPIIFLLKLQQQTTTTMDFTSIVNQIKAQTGELVVTNLTKFQQSMAASVDKVLSSMPDSTERDRALRKLLSSYGVFFYTNF